MSDASKISFAEQCEAAAWSSAFDAAVPLLMGSVEFLRPPDCFISADGVMRTWSTADMVTSKVEMVCGTAALIADRKIHEMRARMVQVRTVSTTEKQNDIEP